MENIETLHTIQPEHTKTRVPFRAIVWGSCFFIALVLVIYFLFPILKTQFIKNQNDTLQKASPIQSTALQQPVVINTQPAKEEVATNYLLPIVIEFGGDVYWEDIGIALDPPVEGSIDIHAEQHKMSFAPNKRYEAGRIYTVTVTNRTEPFYTWTFSTAKAESSDPSLLNQIEEYGKSNYPLQQFLPYKTGAYSIRYVNVKTLEVASSIPQSELLETEVRNWIKGKGVDPSTHAFRWIIKK